MGAVRTTDGGAEGDPITRDTHRFHPQMSNDIIHRGGSCHSGLAVRFARRGHCSAFPPASPAGARDASRRRRRAGAAWSGVMGGERAVVAAQRAHSRRSDPGSPAKRAPARRLRPGTQQRGRGKFNSRRWGESGRARVHRMSSRGLSTGPIAPRFRAAEMSPGLAARSLLFIPAADHDRGGMHV
jgi:hypothetical protein